MIEFPGNITNVKTLQERLIWARERAGLTQKALAKQAGCAQGAIGNVESGARKSLRNLVEVARALKVSAEWLYDGAEPVTPIGSPPPGVQEPAGVYQLPSTRWPFPRIDPARYPAADSEVGRAIEDFALFKLSQLEAAGHQKPTGTGPT